MRAIGFALVLIGVVTIYLAWKGKMGDAFTALATGKAPSTSNSNSGSNSNSFGSNAAKDPLSRGNLPAGTPNMT